MTGRRPRSVNFGAALDSKSGHVSDDVSGTVSDDVPAAISDDMSDGMSVGVSGSVLDDVFSGYARVGASASLRTKKVSVLVTPEEHAAITEWTRRAQSVVGSSRVTASDVGRELFAELAQSRTLTATILERLIGNTQ